MQIAKSKIYLFILFILILESGASFSQNLTEDVSSAISSSGGDKTFFSEKIELISRSGKIFILSNSNKKLSSGDFFTMSLSKLGPVARAVVAKNHNQKVGVKIIKVYSLTKWKKIKKNIDIEIHKGDDAHLFKPKVDKENDIAKVKIDSEVDLYNEDNIDEDLDTIYENKRLIRPDNIITAAYNQLRFTDDATGDTIAGNQFNYAWAYQFAANYWLEGLYGRTQLDAYPRSGDQTIINNFTLRLKYTFKAPLYSYFIPYFGVQTFTVSSPNAGQITADTAQERRLAAAEVKTINDLEKTRLAIGVTLLRRLVPGWFLKVDIGTDILGIGFGIEF